jgi:hypothetical protein
MLQLQRKLVVQVVGRAFYDSNHGKKAIPNRRRDKPNITVWEIHPVMRLSIVDDGEKRGKRKGFPDGNRLSKAPPQWTGLSAPLQVTHVPKRPMNCRV